MQKDRRTQKKNDYHNDCEKDVDAVKDWNGVAIGGPDGLPSEGLENVPSKHKHEQEVKTKVSIEESP